MSLSSSSFCQFQYFTIRLSFNLNSLSQFISPILYKTGFSFDLFVSPKPQILTHSHCPLRPIYLPHTHLIASCTMSLPQGPGPEVMIVIEESTIAGIEIRNAVIRNCQLQKVTVVNCKVTNSTFDNSRILDGSLSFVTLRNSNVTGSQILRDITAQQSSFSQLSAWKSVFAACIFDEAKVIRSEIRDGKVNACQLQTSHVIGVTGRNSTLIQCPVVQECQLQETSLHDVGQVSRTSMKKCSVTTAAFKLEKLPTEIRLLLFRRYLDANEGYPVDLLKALFPAQVLWFEVIQLYCEMTPLFLNRDSQTKFGCFNTIPLFARENLVNVHIS